MWNVLICLFLALLLTRARTDNHTKDLREEDKMTTPELISKHGYTAEIHKFQTSDGYILEMHRIPNGINLTAALNKPVVFLQHGLLSSSADWIVIGPEKALGYVLADHGYDVWMGNSRGNIYSRQHAVFKPNQRRFWDFSWHEMGLYDIPNAIDYVLNVTGQKDLFYVGHSQGTTQFYVMTSLLPEYNTKIKAMFSLSPIAFMTNLPNLFARSFAFMYRIYPSIFEWFASYEIGHSQLIKIVKSELCRENTLSQRILCNYPLFLLVGFDEDQVNTTTAEVAMNHLPAGASIKQVLHYVQEINVNEFKQYDYKSYVGGNKKHYGTDKPPEYNLSKITCPVALYYGNNDGLTSSIDRPLVPGSG